MKQEHGFTVIEAIVAIVVLAVVGSFFFIQRNDLETSAHDQARKTAINSMYYGLTEVFYKENDYYPTAIDSNVLRSVAPELFTDQQGLVINSPEGEYFYEGVNCDIDGRCKSFKLTAKLEREAEYVRRPE
jgi:type II secretory pathway pseudopilin PulG